MKFVAAKDYDSNLFTIMEEQVLEKVKAKLNGKKLTAVI